MKKTKAKKNIRMSSTMKDVLKLLCGGVVIPMIFLLPGSALIIKEFLKNQNINKKHDKFRYFLKRAKEKRLIKIVTKNGSDFLEITDLGRKELLRYDIDELQIRKSKLWDGKWRVVIFDIPEMFRNGRIALTQKLKELGFYSLQKSVFVFPYECENEIDFMREFFDVKKFVILLHSSTLGECHDLVLKNHFDLL
jgi:DNA-binding transcriptional regulator PaaX